MRAARITTRAGHVRILELPPNASLQDWWFAVRGLGEIVGDQWCMPVSSILLVDLIEVPDHRQMRPATEEEVAEAIKRGEWKPPAGFSA
jgi:hypothetical protein